MLSVVNHILYYYLVLSKRPYFDFAYLLNNTTLTCNHDGTSLFLGVEISANCCDFCISTDNLVTLIDADFFI
jgi:hypothetical protein